MRAALSIAETFGGDTISNAVDADRDISVRLQARLIGDHVQGGNNPTIWVNNETSSVNVVSINAGYRLGKPITGLDASDWMRVLAAQCRGGEENE
jgi:hypothetical protein